MFEHRKGYVLACVSVRVSLHYFAHFAFTFQGKLINHLDGKTVKTGHLKRKYKSPLRFTSLIVIVVVRSWSLLHVVVVVWLIDFCDDCHP